MLAPELFPCTDGTTYVCAISSEEPLPADPAQVVPDPGAIERLEAMCRTMSPVLASTKIPGAAGMLSPGHAGRTTADRAGAGGCRRLCRHRHSVRGILNAPATGEATPELIVVGAAHTVDLAPFDPGRLPRLEPARLRPSPSAPFGRCMSPTRGPGVSFGPSCLAHSDTRT
jgi:hypothetical protein